MDIGGNISARLQVFDAVPNEIGEGVKEWRDAVELRGFLDLKNEDTDYSSFKVRLESATHIFICAYTPLPEEVTAEVARLVIEGRVYEIMFIDDPMGLHSHYEFYLSEKGGV